MEIMKRLSILALLLFARTTLAESDGSIAPTAPPEVRTAQNMVYRDLIGPLAEKEGGRSKFSRASIPGTQRRVRVVDAAIHMDALGHAFLRFAVDETRGFAEMGWTNNTITGCVYVFTNDIFVKKGEEIRPAALLLGKNLKAAPQITCHEGGRSS
jgi:hypothetical protein